MARRRKAGFVGRRWAVARISEWLESDSPSLVVTGPAGAGKTALVKAAAGGRHASATGRTFHALHLCRANVAASTDPIRVLAEIAAQLGRSVPGYQVLHGAAGRYMSTFREDPAQHATRAVLDSMGPGMAFERALTLPFEALVTRRGRFPVPGDGPGRKAVVVIDGLDEVPAGIAVSGLVDLFAKRLATPVPGLRLLLTVRSGPALELLNPDVVLDLVADRPAGAQDVREYLDAVGVLPARRRAAVADAAGDCYLYADVAMRLVGIGGAGRELPSGLGALYDEALAGIGGPESLSRLAFAVLARARDDGFTMGQIAGLIGADTAAVAAALHPGRQLLTGIDPVRPHHRCLSEHLWASTPNPGATDWTIARHLHQQGSGRWLDAPRPYALRNVLNHLADAVLVDTPEVRQAIHDTVTDPAYVTAAVHVLGVDDLLSTLSYVDERTNGQAADAVTLTSILRRQARAMRQARDQGDVALLAQQLVYEAATRGAVDIARRFAECFPDRGILTLWATADSPVRLLPDAIEGHTGRVTSVAVTSDGTRAFSASRDRVTRIWRLASGRLAHASPTVANVCDMYTEPDTGYVVASTSDGRAEVWDADVGAPVGELTGAKTVPVSAFATNNGGTVGVGGDSDGNATVWDLTVGEPVRRLPCASVLITAIAITPDGRTAATGSLSGEVTVWDLATGEATARVRGEARVTSLALSPSADRLLVGGEGLAVYHLTGTRLAGSGSARLLGRLLTSHDVTATVFNPLMPGYVLFGCARGQVAYVRLPVDHLGVDLGWI